jgi:hypothetical protein
MLSWYCFQVFIIIIIINSVVTVLLLDYPGLLDTNSMDLLRFVTMFESSYEYYFGHCLLSEV